MRFCTNSAIFHELCNLWRFFGLLYEIATSHNIRTPELHLQQFVENLLILLSHKGDNKSRLSPVLQKNYIFGHDDGEFK